MDGSARTTAPSPSTSRRRTSSSGSRPTRTACSRSTTTRPDFVLPGFRANEARSFIEGGLRDFSISRAARRGGSRCRGTDQVAYVWADALVNYLSALTYARRARTWPVYWPASVTSWRKTSSASTASTGRRCCLSAGYEVAAADLRPRLPLLDKRKISKSIGNVIDPLDLVDVYGAMRFASGRARRLVRPGRRRARWTASASGTSASSANELGNLLSRTTAMIVRYRDGQLEPARTRGRTRRSVARLARRDHRRPRRLGRDGRARDDLGARPPAQRHVERDEAVGAGEGRRARGELDRALYDLVDGLRIAAVALAAYLPETSERSSKPSGCPSTSPGTTSRTAAPKRSPGIGRRSRSSRGSTSPPRRRSVIDTHAHLDALEAPARALDRARAAGVTRVVTIGTGIDSCRRALDVDRARRRLRSARDRSAPGRRPAKRAAWASSAPCSTSRARSRSVRRVSTTTTATTHEGRAAEPLRGAAGAGRGARPAGRRPHPRGRTPRRRQCSRASTAPSSCTASPSRSCSRRRSSAAGTSRSPAT